MAKTRASSGNLVSDQRLQDSSEDDAGIKYTVVVGNVIDGLSFHGPFDGFDEANNWADDELRNADWVVGKLHPPASR